MFFRPSGFDTPIDQGKDSVEVMWDEPSQSYFFHNQAPCENEGGELGYWTLSPKPQNPKP